MWSAFFPVCIPWLKVRVRTAGHEGDDSGTAYSELRALMSLVHATQDPKRAVELLPRGAAVLEQLTLRPESADAREGRLLVPGSRGNPAVIP